MNFLAFPFFAFFIPGVTLACTPVKTLPEQGLKEENEAIPPPNILLITADDLGKNLSCYGDEVIQTPNIDGLAQNGLIFNNGYVTQSSSSPSRSSILTGLYPHANGHIGLANHGFKINDEKLDNIPAYLNKKGYRNGIIGKLHVSPASIFPFDYSRQDVHETRDMELVVDRVEEFISLSSEKPFFLYLNYFDPHAPLLQKVNNRPEKVFEVSDVKPFDYQGVDDVKQLQRIADYYSCVKRLDEGIGLLLKKIKELDVLKNTVVIFVGDNGAPFTRGKGACYESSVNVPFLISWPQKIKVNSKSDALVSTVDIFPTIIDILGNNIPENIQGRSLLPILNETSESIRDNLFTEFNYHGKMLDHFFPRRTIRNKQYKLILNLAANYIPNGLTGVDGDTSFNMSQQSKYNDTWVQKVYNRLKSPPEIEFFDLINDPFEKNNLSEKTEYKEIIAEMKKQLEDWMTATNDPYNSEEVILNEIESLKENQ